MFLDEKYITETMLKMVSDEGKRAMSLGLAKKEDLKAIIAATLEAMIKTSEKFTLLETLTEVHKKLSAIKLPGDLEKVANPELEMNVEDLFEEDEADDLVTVELGQPTIKPNPEELPATTEGWEAAMKKKQSILVALEKRAYDFGLAGDHEAAYEAERMMSMVEALDGEEEINMLPEIGQNTND